MTQDQQFADLLPQIRAIIHRRRTSWTVSSLAWEDVESILMTRIWQKLPLYRIDKPFENWANRLISNTLSNLLRDTIYKHERPCITASAGGGECAFNRGGDKCGFTPSGHQCTECPLYAKWTKKKEIARNIKASLPLDHHDIEVQNMQEDFLDIASAKATIDARILEQLDAHDAKVYRLLFIEGMSMEDVSKAMKYHTQNNSRVGQMLRKLVVRFKEMAKVIIEAEDLA